MKIIIEVIKDKERGLRKIKVIPDGFSDSQEVVAALAIAQHDYLNTLKAKGREIAMDFVAQSMEDEHDDSKESQ